MAELNPNIPGSALTQGSALDRMQQGVQVQGQAQNNQMQQYQIQELLRKQGVMRDLQQSAGKYDLSTPSGRSGFTSEAMSKDIGTGLELASSFGQLSKQEQALQEQKDSVLASGLYGFMQKMNGVLVKGPGNVSKEEAWGLTQEWRSFVKSAYDNGLVDPKRIPPSSIPGNPDMGFIHTALMSTGAGRELLKADLDEKKQRETELHQREEERQGQERIDIAKKNAGDFSGQTGELLAAFAERGISLPAGLRSKQQQAATLNGLISRNPGMSMDEIADKVKSGQLTVGAEKTEASVLGRREAAILPVEKSITKKGGFLDQAEAAVNQVDFPKLKAAGAFESWGKDQESDPALSRYKAAVAELRAEYSIVLSKGGQVTDAARHEAAKVIPDLITKEQFKSIKQTVLQGIESSKGGVEESIGEVTGRKQPTSLDGNNDPLGIR